jgi:predicted glycoside hydrolase/deacetylase ChbG (UPF0249 family)
MNRSTPHPTDAPSPGISRRATLKTLAATALAAPYIGRAQADRSWGERLGWEPDEVVVILHVDDAGMHHAANRGAIESVARGVATSWATMMPCPWVPEIAQYLVEHPDIDNGLHLTLTSEWKRYRWGPVAGRSQVPGLVDAEGCLWHSVPQVARSATPDEVETEIRAQIEKAETMNMPVTHLDSHMGTLFARPDYFERWLKVAIEKQLPLLAPGGHLTYVSRSHGEPARLLKSLVPRIWDAGLPVIDDLHTGSYEGPPESRTDWLLQLLGALRPGVTEVLFHASIPTDDFPLVTGSHAQRLADTRALTDPRVRQLIEDKGIHLTTWRELMRRRSAA